VNLVKKRVAIKPSPVFWRAMGIVNGLCMMVLLLRLAFMVPAVNLWFYRWQYTVNDTYRHVNMLPADLHDVTRHLIRYMQGLLDRDTGLQIQTIVGGQVRDFFSPIEIRHMVDVYDLFAWGRVILYTCAPLLFATTLAFVTRGRRHLAMLHHGWKWVSGTVIVLLLIPAIFMLINWSRAFDLFHEIFFDNDYWILNPQVDLLVRIVPNGFFIHATMVIGGVFGTGLLGMFWLGRRRAVEGSLES